LFKFFWHANEIIHLFYVYFCVLAGLSIHLLLCILSKEQKNMHTYLLLSKRASAEIVVTQKVYLEGVINVAFI
jgi:hypothetical protein